ncbi:MAG: PIN domain-containing protein [Terriglobales bacterium]
MHVIADTGYLVALVARNDQHHEWARNLAEQLTPPLLTCEAVLAETAFHLKSSMQVLEMLRRGAVQLAFDCTIQLEHLHDLATRYGDRRPDLADLCLIRMSELNPRLPIVTVDAVDFRAYRRNKREVIPIICPPNC